MADQHVGRGDIGGLERCAKIIDDRRGGSVAVALRAAEPSSSLIKVTVRGLQCDLAPDSVRMEARPMVAAAKITLGAPSPAISRLSRRRRPIFTRGLAGPQSAG